ncbi:MAG: histidine kinase dimerization/phospho-acceptor domain-containing protein [Hydrogenophaga sp.]|nr:histidine kinase dimerization/phospho-acceptor domain-containing protein [Hydrogenophaga sp.]
MSTAPLTLQRRLLLYLLITAPLVWSVALGFSMVKARHEVNELFDTEMIRLARQIQVISPSLSPDRTGPQWLAEPPPTQGEADLNDLAVAVWNQDGEMLVVDREGVALPWHPDATGFMDVSVGAEAWRVYYLPAPGLKGLIAAGQRMDERDELVWGLVSSQMVPWLLVLPVLLAAMAWAVRRALEPMKAVTESLHARSADDLHPLPLDLAPQELHPLLEAMNSLFQRIATTLEHERRFTADAAHELRTPMAVLSAQWTVFQGARDDAERQRAAEKLTQGLARASRLMEQLLSLSRLEATQGLTQPQPLRWHELVEQVLSDVLPLAERRQIELACEWNEPGETGESDGPAWLGDNTLMALLLRNLLDNAVRYAPAGSTVALRLTAHSVAVDNATQSAVTQRMAPADLAQWGKRFHRPDGQQESGSGLGVSIARRIALLHGLTLHYRMGANGHVVAELARSAVPAAPPVAEP